METEAKPLQATFDIDGEEFDVEEGVGFSPDETYTFTLDREPTGKFMMYGKTPKPITVEGHTFIPAGLLVLGKKIPKELHIEYLSHPDQFEIFTPGVVNGQQQLVPGKDFEKFRPYMSQVINIGWKCVENGRLVFQQLSMPFRVNPSHPEFENDATALARKFGYEPPQAKINGKPNPEKATLSWLHPGVGIKAKTYMIKSKDPAYRDTVAIDIDSIELVGGEDRTSPQATITTDDIDADLKVSIMEAAEGCSKPAEVFKKIVDEAKKEKRTFTSAQKTDLLAAINRMKDAKEILQ